MRPFLFCLLFVAAVVASAATLEARPRLFGGCHGGPIRNAIANRPHLLARTATVIRERERRPLQRIISNYRGRSQCSG